MNESSRGRALDSLASKTLREAPEPHPDRKELARYLLGRGSDQLETAIAERRPLLETPGRLTDYDEVAATGRPSQRELEQR